MILKKSSSLFLIQGEFSTMRSFVFVTTLVMILLKNIIICHCIGVPKTNMLRFKAFYSNWLYLPFTTGFIVIALYNIYWEINTIIFPPWSILHEWDANEEFLDNIFESLIASRFIARYRKREGKEIEMKERVWI